MIKFKINVIEEMTKKGYSTARIRREKLLSESTLQKLRSNGNITTDSLNTICCILRLQPSDIIECEYTNEEKIKYF